MGEMGDMDGKIGGQGWKTCNKLLSFLWFKMDLKCLFGSDKKEIKVRKVLNMAKLFVS